MANSSFETFKQGGEAIDDAAKKTGQQAQGVYEQAKNTASDAYDSAAGYAGDAVARVQDSASELDEMVSEQVGRHPEGHGGARHRNRVCAWAAVCLIA